MSIIPESSIEEVRSLADIVDVVGDYVRLKKRGSNYVGLCPFHSEKTPSFNVNPKLGIFKCFGCGEGGDIFSFVSRVETLSFPESVRLLAERVNVIIPEEDAPGEDASETEAIYHALRFAARFFHDGLAQMEDAQVSRDYLKNRGVSHDSIKSFGIGYAPDGWDSLLKAATEAHLDLAVLEGAGLIIAKKDGKGYYDRYRHRLIFPIFSHVGKVLGFGGRILREDDEPKYINSPETKVYNKSRVLYGLYHAKNTIRSKEEVIMVEGYTDVVSLNQSGVENVVASSGTALTEDQIAALSRYAKTIVLLYDADQAGLRAALRAIDLILKQGMIPYAVSLPDGEDPDSFVRTHGGPKFETYLREHRQNFIEFVLENAAKAGRMDSPEGQAAVQRTIIQSIAQIPDDLVRESYLRSASSSLDIPDMQLRPILAATMKGDRKKVVIRAKRKSDRDDFHARQPPAITERKGVSPTPIPAEKKLLQLMLEEGTAMIEWVMGSMPLSDFTEGASRSMAAELVRQYEAEELDRRIFFGDSMGNDIQALAADIMMVAVEPSENWKRRKNISVPKLDEDASEAAAGAMVILKLHRIEETEERLRKEIYQRQTAGEDTLELNQKLLELQRFEKVVKDRKFIASV